MIKMKKIAAILAAACMSISVAAVAASCGGGDNSSSSSSSSALQKVNYSITFKDQDGLSVSPISLSLYQNEELKSTATISAQGVSSGEVYEGSYVVEVELPEGYLQTSNTITVTFTAADATEEISVLNNTPNGTAARPFGFIVSDTYEMETTIPANGTYYYARSAVNAKLVIESDSVQVHYNATVYSPREGVVEVPLVADEDDVKGQIVFTVTNLTNAEVTVVLKLVYPEGTYENPMELSLEEENTATVVGYSIVNFGWTASSTGTLSLVSESANNYLKVYNKTTGRVEGYVHTSASAPLEIAVNEGDEISVEITVQGTVAENAENVITFTASVA
ncbi:MAG: hypothetical protein IJV80_00485 [Clostridia bacterium]|nr:hypothetical protein [Clostridia bacterium]